MVLSAADGKGSRISTYHITSITSTKAVLHDPFLSWGVWIFNTIANHEDRSSRPLLKNASFRSHTQMVDFLPTICVIFCGPSVAFFSFQNCFVRLAGRDLEDLL